jgi:homoserine kinase type II
VKDRDRQTFAPDELAIVLSHFPVGVIESSTPFARGSRKSPKVGIVSQGGKFVLKRRDPERAGLERIRFAHALQTHLMAARFPLPALIHPADRDETLLILNDFVYELFEFVGGHDYKATAGETTDAGAILARFHRAVESFAASNGGLGPDYHDALAVQTGLNAIPGQISMHESAMGKQAEVLGVSKALFDSYDAAARRAEAAGLEALDGHIIHSDWHPGNMLFRNDRVAAVVDYDSVRRSRRVLDVANGLLQFSIAREGSPDSWPDQLDESRLRQFQMGYESVIQLSAAEKSCLAPLMIEALIGECVVPIAATGSFGRLQGFGFMKVVRRKVKWLEEHGSRLTEAFLAAPAD